ncbi:hypothetical protein [Polyangium sp. y55x31]|uniref:hypothetical protein n=1 Tax=Polyangium sp. y55x31 TaxID=3042688 RepID=UPI002482465C|nr:hypothetical protein [Polyangium sp. y55x31]MDI1482876.1 hypothetical protein [Polyangium sp. y55x31]
MSKTKRILHVVSNVDHYDGRSTPTGLWLSELTHAYDVFAARGYEQRLVSPKGGRIPLEPRSLAWPFLGASAKARLADPTWCEEVLAGVATKVPYNAEAEMRARGARYEKNIVPFLSKVVVDGKLVTGQNPQSAKATARSVVSLLSS